LYTVFTTAEQRYQITRTIHDWTTHDTSLSHTHKLTAITGVKRLIHMQTLSCSQSHGQTYSHHKMILRHITYKQHSWFIHDLQI